MTMSTPFARSPRLRESSTNWRALVLWVLASALAVLIPTAGWTQAPRQVVTIGPPEKNNAYYFDQAAQIAAWWNSDPQPEIRVITGESVTGGLYDSNNNLIPGSYTVTYDFEIVTGIEIVAWDTSGKPEAVWVTLGPGGQFSPQQPPAPAQQQIPLPASWDWDAALAKGVTITGQWVHYKQGKLQDKGNSTLEMKWDGNQALYIAWGNADPVNLTRGPERRR